jgi:plasmid maintenance system antidote protein VapI
MIDRRKKYKIQETHAYPHVGSLLKAHFLKEKTNRSAIARSMDVAANVMGQYLKQESLQLGIIWKLSLATNHNFLAQLAEQLPVDYVSGKERELQKLLVEKEEQIKTLETELAVYKRIVGK